MCPELVVVGFTNIDENTTPSIKTESPGGAGYFVAIAASRIIQNVGLVSHIGYDFDTTFLRTRVKHEGLKFDLHEQTGRSHLIYKSDVDKSERMISLDLGANKNLSPADVPKSWLSQLKYVHIATMPPYQQAEFIHFLINRLQMHICQLTQIFTSFKILI